MNNNISVNFLMIKRVLIINLRHHGDVLLSSPVFSVLNNRFPHLSIDAYIYADTFPMLEGHPAINTFHLYEKKWKHHSKWKRYLKEIRFLWAIRKNNYDLIINLTEGDRGAIAVKVSQPRFAVGVDPHGRGMKNKAKWYTHLIKHSPNPRHTVEMHLDALRCLNILPTAQEKLLSLNIPTDILIQIQRQLPKKYIVIHAVSRWMFKTLPSNTIVDIAQYFQREGYHIVLTGSSDPHEMAFIDTINSQLEGAYNLSGTLCLKAFSAVIKNSCFLFTVDSVSLHIASTFKTPVIAIFGPTCHKKWGPYNHPHACVITPKISCRPCYQAGCGGSGHSACLYEYPSSEIIETITQFIHHTSCV